MYQDILLPVDGSEGAMAIVHHAADIAARSDATVRVLFVADTSRDSVTTVQSNVVDALVKKGETIVEDVGDGLSDRNVTVGTDVVQGDPAPTIANYADRYGFDLIVLPTQGRTDLSRRFLGSTTEKVVRLAPVPVLTARMRADDTLTFPYENVLVPTDGSPEATAAARHALELAAWLDATVHVLSVIDDTWLGPDIDPVSAAEFDHSANEVVDGVAADAEAHGVTDVETHVEHGAPADQILEAVETDDVHAIVMGTTGRRGIERILLGSVAEKTVRSAPVPVITVGHRA